MSHISTPENHRMEQMGAHLDGYSESEQDGHHAEHAAPER